jgi:hypothetical protein
MNFWPWSQAISRLGLPADSVPVTHEMTVRDPGPIGKWRIRTVSLESR